MFGRISTFKSEEYGMKGARWRGTRMSRMPDTRVGRILIQMISLASGIQKVRGRTRTSSARIGRISRYHMSGIWCEKKPVYGCVNTKTNLDLQDTICQVGDDFKDSKKTRQDIRTPPGYQNYFELDFLCYFYIFVFSRVSVLVVCRVFRSSLLG
ncbi:Protein CBG26104 [Caenorhabditis briggsae]|uniref:Protein CBG26104 n=1 Tax=Caenorhabditis briggsae TaxID=6238 RepID=B6IJK7_CAEBR|nr:Protein CBG26104 [Caenorhabditis briggsae]CAS00087.1 Protein CBG26104 [Caenorhabditis briggsae]